MLSALVSALAGSIGVAPTANIDPERRYPSMFDLIHGSAFDIAGKGIANPVATLLDGGVDARPGQQAASDQLMHAIERVGEAGIMTPDVGGKATTREVTEAVCNAIGGRNVLTG